jgi:hypothetical protein
VITARLLQSDNRAHLCDTLIVESSSLVDGGVQYVPIERLAGMGLEPRRG